MSLSTPNPATPPALNGVKSRGFTLIEIMIVLSILAIILATGVPSMLRSLEKEGLRKAQSDLVEACSHARAQAILSGVPMELVIRAEGNQVSVEPLKTGPGAKSESVFENPEAPSLPNGAPKNFSARLEDDIGIRFLYVNFKDHMESPEARVRFFPNGTCDEFTIIFFSPKGERKLSLEVVTGLAEVEVIR
jgi:prepilin-type N-terminal cleavage/methylation domain-containing protein